MEPFIDFNDNVLPLIIAGGQVVDILNELESPLSCDDVLNIFYQTCRAVQHMHKQAPPIIHRDLKVKKDEQGPVDQN